MSNDCPFCSVTEERKVFSGEHVLAIWDAYPVTEGHILIVPYRHIPVFSELNDNEKTEIIKGVEIAQSILRQQYSVSAFNVGFNEGPAAGQTVGHFHIHVIPRRAGDMHDPRGGVRHVIPDKGNYLKKTAYQTISQNAVPHERGLISGREDALISHLLPYIDQAIAIDVVVSFILDSGFRLLQPHFQDLLDRGGRLRLLTGDYLDVTTPSVLRNLLDLSGDAKLSVFESSQLSFHPKSWIFHFPQNNGLAIVGSSNISETALRHGIEWNYRIFNSTEVTGWRDVLDGFDKLILEPEVKELTHDWINHYEQRRSLQDNRPAQEIEFEPELLPEAPPPHHIQMEALTALRNRRKAGYTAGLVVLATGLGKTWLSAFDSEEFDRVLFVAHRDEILTQAMGTFRKIRPNARFGRFTGSEKDLEADVIFASIQTLGRTSHLKTFKPTSFDYIIVDEFHHAAARTYRTLIDYFKPQFMLGLTATPERTDGGDLLGLCQENLVFRCDMFRGIDEGLLSKFIYFGVPDNIDYEQIPWRSASFDETELTKALATRARAENAYQQYLKHGETRAIGFCCSRLHADFMKEFFVEKGVRAVAVHSGISSAPLATSLEQLRSGHLDIVFSVDILNEGVDVPEVDTVLMLRPTESTIIWLQQFGRGLRLSETKKHLKVVDYIGNHRIFLNKARALLQQEEGDRPLSLALKAIRNGEFKLPSGCEITYELEALDLLQSLLRRSDRGDEIDAYYTDFKMRHNRRPMALEMFHAGFNPKNTGHGNWFNFVKSKNDFTNTEQEILQLHGWIFDRISITRMTKTYKMLLLKAMLAAEAFPGEIEIGLLTKHFAEISSRNPNFLKDLSITPESESALKKLIIENPINAFCHERDPLLKFDEDKLLTSFSVTENFLDNFKELATEVIEWRIGEYLNRIITEDIVEVVKPEYSSPDDAKTNTGVGPEIWREYMREEVPILFGESFNTGKWYSGIVMVGQNMILLVTLEKDNLSTGKIYKDYFIDEISFHWNSQVQTSLDSRHGRIMTGKMPGFTLHLFVRKNKLRGNKAAPFIYCGIVSVNSWNSEKPIELVLKLENPLPSHYQKIFINQNKPKDALIS